MKKQLLLILFVFCAVSLGYSQADCLNALTLTPGTPQAGDSTGQVGDFPNAGGAPENPCNANYNDDEYWFEYTATADGETLDLSVTDITDTWAGVFVLDDCPTGVPTCVASATNNGSTADLVVSTPALTMGVSYKIVISSWGTPDSTAFTMNSTVVPPLTCVPPAGTAVLGTSDCGADTFMVDIDITDLGDGSPSLDDGVNPPVPITATGPFSVGPYPIGTAVSFTLLHGSDTLCDVDLGSLVAYCPPPNDVCATATNIVPSATAAPVYITGTTNGNTPSGEVTDADMSCVSAFAFGSGRDTWFSVEVPASGEINVATQAAAGSALDDTIVTVFSGACGSLVEVGCDDDNPTPSDFFSLVELTGQVPGDILIVRVQEYAADASRRGPDDGDFEITAYAADPTLGLEDVAFEDFKYFPNPVNGTLSLRAQDNIQAVSVYNMLGQEVLRTAPNGLQDELDMSGLNTGAYFLKVRINDVEENFRIIKE